MVQDMAAYMRAYRANGRDITRPAPQRQNKSAGRVAHHVPGHNTGSVLGEAALLRDEIRRHELRDGSGVLMYPERVTGRSEAIPAEIEAAILRRRD
jgi:hypothetical protein